MNEYIKVMNIPSLWSKEYRDALSRYERLGDIK